MAQIEDLLKELIELQKEQMRRTRRYHTLKFLGATVPMILIFAFSIWGSYALYQSLTDTFQNSSGMMDIETLRGLMES